MLLLLEVATLLVHSFFVDTVEHSNDFLLFLVFVEHHTKYWTRSRWLKQYIRILNTLRHHQQINNSPFHFNAKISATEWWFKVRVRAKLSLNEAFWDMWIKLGAKKKTKQFKVSHFEFSICEKYRSLFGSSSPLLSPFIIKLATLVRRWISISAQL